MNSISWFLYAVDVAGNIGKIGGILFILTIVVGVVVGFIVLIASVPPHTEADNAIRKRCVNFLRSRRYLGILGLLLLLGIFSPSQKTMYLILGSEVGEEVIASETGKRVQDAINKKLDEYLEN